MVALVLHLGETWAMHKNSVGGFNNKIHVVSL